MLRQWLKASALSIAYHPMVWPLYFFPRIIFGNGEELNDTMRTELTELRKEFLQVFPGDTQEARSCCSGFLSRMMKNHHP
jgi:hypothetical protein